MYNHVIDFLEHNNVSYDFQFGFRKHHSTKHPIITMVEKVSNALDTGRIVVGVFLDSKIPFTRLIIVFYIYKIYAYGIRGNIYDCFKSYLKIRKQYG